MTRTGYVLRFYVTRRDSVGTVARCGIHLADSDPWVIAGASLATGLVVCEVCGRTSQA